MRDLYVNDPVGLFGERELRQFLRVQRIAVNVPDCLALRLADEIQGIALIAWELMLTYDDTDLNYITSASSLENWLYFLRTGAPVNFILAESNIDDTYYTTHPIEKQYIVAMLRDPKRIFFLTVNYLSDPELIQETNLAFYRLFSSGIMNMQMTIIPENTTIEDLRANCTEFSYWVINEKNDDIILEITSDTSNLIQVIIENAS